MSKSNTTRIRVRYICVNQKCLASNAPIFNIIKGTNEQGIITDQEVNCMECGKRNNIKIQGEIPMITGDRGL